VNEQDDLGRTVARWFEAEAVAPVPAARLQRAIDATRARRPRSGLLASFGSAWVEPGLVGSAQRFSLPIVVVLVLLMLALAAGAIMVGGQPRRLPAVGPAPALGTPAGNGLIAFANAGDIHVGDPVSGTSTAIVTGPEHDTRPVFAPDGQHVAFLRARPNNDATVVVVRVDGSDLRVAGEIVSDTFPTFAWTPDSTSIVVEHTRRDLPFRTLLTLVDASGGGEPRLITPPVQTQPGSIYMSAHAQVAPMFRPPSGDQIVGVMGDAGFRGGVLSVIDLEGVPVDGFVPPSLSTPHLFKIYQPTWSPDGSVISFAYSADVTATNTPRDLRLHLMDADGSNLRRLATPFFIGSWSPDGTTIAFEKPHPTVTGADAVIAIVDVETGSERVLEGTSAVVKKILEPTTDPDLYWLGSGTHFAYASWSWTPDGRGIVILERFGTRPFVVDIETGDVTELPWESDSVVSWQRVPVE
jgi:dipeptidyl aminopeptidase/acylaminoacyl peptidase